MGGISRPGVVRGRRGAPDPGRQRAPPPPLHDICPGQRVGSSGAGAPGPGVEGGGGRRWSDVGSHRERGGDGAAGAPGSRVGTDRAAGPGRAVERGGGRPGGQPGRPATVRWNEVGTDRLAGPRRPATGRWSEVGTFRAVDGTAAEEVPTPGHDEAPARGAGASGDQGRAAGRRRTVRRGGATAAGSRTVRGAGRPPRASPSAPPSCA